MECLLEVRSERVLRILLIAEFAFRSSAVRGQWRHHNLLNGEGVRQKRSPQVLAWIGSHLSAQLASLLFLQEET